MSRGFVKEDDQEEVPMIPPRADLPNGLTNYVTPKGMDKLLNEKESLIKEREKLEGSNEKERRIASNLIHAKIQLLDDRISSAQIVDLAKQPKGEVRFGALISLKIGNSKQAQNYQIVGVDEADVSNKKIAFNSPIASLLMGKKVGDKPVLKLAKEDRVFEILAIEYEA